MGTRLCSEPTGQPGPDSCRGTPWTRCFWDPQAAYLWWGAAGGGGRCAGGAAAVGSASTQSGSLQPWRSECRGEAPWLWVICPFLPQRSLTKEMGRGQRCPPLGDSR